MYPILVTEGARRYEHDRSDQLAVLRAARRSHRLRLSRIRPRDLRVGEATENTGIGLWNTSLISLEEKGLSAQEWRFFLRFQEHS